MRLRKGEGLLLNLDTAQNMAIICVSVNTGLLPVYLDYPDWPDIAQTFNKLLC